MPVFPQVGSHAAKILFGLALLASGQNSTITGTLAGQVWAQFYYSYTNFKFFFDSESPRGAHLYVPCIAS